MKLLPSMTKRGERVGESDKTANSEPIGQKLGAAKGELTQDHNDEIIEVSRKRLAG